MSDSVRLTEGAQLGRYRIVRRLGAGAMGEVFLADDPQIGRALALKTVRVEEGRAQEVEERKRRLLREARAAGKLLHPNIVTLFDAGEDKGMLYLAFEFVEGSDLAQRVADGPPLSLAEALAIVRQAADALDYAHRQGVIHRDIKPSNLMLTADGRVKVADFGIAKVLDQTSDLTMTGAVVGSPHYLSPEQIRGDELDGRTDVFSLGVLFYEILCSHKPFEADTLTTLVYRILNQEPTPILVRRPDLGPRLEQLVKKMLAKDRANRHATAAEVVAEIAACELELPPKRLAGRARPEEMPTESTRLLPADPPSPPIAPPPASATWVPPPPPPAEPPRPQPTSAPRPTSVPPRPPPSVAVSASSASGAPRATTDSTAFAPPAAPRSRLVGIAIAAVALLALLVVAGLGARRFVANRAASEPAPASATTSPASESSSAAREPVATAPPTTIVEGGGDVPPAQLEPSVDPSLVAESGALVPAGAPAVTGSLPDEPGERKRLAPQPGIVAGQPVTSAPIKPPSGTPAPAPSAPAATAPPIRIEPTRPAPAPAPAPVETPPLQPYQPSPASSPPTAADAVPEASEAAPAPDSATAREELIARLPVSREMVTGMSLSFEVLPKDLAERIVVRFDRIVIGRASDWNTKRRDGRAYAIAEPGLHILTFLLDGTDVHRIRIDARAGGAGPTVISLELPQFAKRGRRPGGG